MERQLGKVLKFEGSNENKVKNTWPVNVVQYIPLITYDIIIWEHEGGVYSHKQGYVVHMFQSILNSLVKPSSYCCP